MKQILFSLSLVTSDSPSLPRLSCDRAVIAMMNERTLGNSASRLHASLVEQHTREWMARSMLFLSVLRKLRVRHRRRCPYHLCTRCPVYPG